MDAVASLLAVAMFAGQQLEPWQRFPPESVCKRNWELCDKYARELDNMADIVGGHNATRFRDMAGEARTLQSVWWSFWWVASPVDRTSKNWWAATLREQLGDQAYFSSVWPSALPWNHFPVAGGR